MFYLDINFISDVSFKVDEKNTNEMGLDIEYKYKTEFSWL